MTVKELMIALLDAAMSAEVLIATTTGTVKIDEVYAKFPTDTVRLIPEEDLADEAAVDKQVRANMGG